MQIPFKSCLESGMELTFKDLKEKRTKLVEAQWKLQDKLQEKASELLRVNRSGFPGEYFA